MLALALGLGIQPAAGEEGVVLEDKRLYDEHPLYIDLDLDPAESTDDDNFVVMQEGSVILYADSGMRIVAAEDKTSYTLYNPTSAAKSIAPSELYVGRSMADLSEEELDELRSIAGEQYENPTFATETSPEGNLYLFVSSNDESDIDSLFTIYEGYFVELIQYHDDYSEQTDADDDFARSLLYGIEFSTDESQAE